MIADPYQTKPIGSAEVKNDRLDTKVRKQLRRVVMIAASYVPLYEICGAAHLCAGASNPSRSGQTSKTRFTLYSITMESSTRGTVQ